MTSLVEALADHSALGAFEGDDVLAAGIELPNAAGGLREALAIEPQAFHSDGESRYVVLEVNLEKIRFDPIRDGKDGPKLGWRRVHVFKATGATFVDADLVSKHVEEQRERILRAREEAEGVERLPYGEDLQREHDEGEHADGLVDGCPACDAEVEAEAEE